MTGGFLALGGACGVSALTVSFGLGPYARGFSVAGPSANQLSTVTPVTQLTTTPKTTRLASDD